MSIPADTNSNITEATMKSLIVSLHEIGAIKFGSFKLKSGMQSPIYFDLRLIVSHPGVLKLISELIWTIMTERNLVYDAICGVPYTAVPIATVVSVQHEVPMILKRKEQKKHGTGNILEGIFAPNSSCVIIEDVVTTGSSVIETVEVLRAHHIVVNDAIVLLNREQGAEANLATHNIRLHSVLGVHQILDLLHAENMISVDHLKDSKKFFQASCESAKENLQLEKIVKTKIVPHMQCSLSTKLLEIMLQKQTNLALSADLHNYKSVLEALEHLGEFICLVKIHVDLLNLESYEQILIFRRKLHELAQLHSFLIMEDRKLADIGSIVEKQLSGKPFEIEKLANFVTVHGLSGPGILKGISNSFPHLGIVLVAEMSSEGNLQTPEYRNGVVALTNGYEKFVAGFVSQSRVESTGQFLQFTPGVGLNVSGDNLGQRYTTVADAVEVRGADVIIVGRGILNQDPSHWVETALEFKKQGWNSWKKRILQDNP